MYHSYMDTNPNASVTAETAELTSRAIKESGYSLAEISRRTLIPYVSLHRKVNGVKDFTVRELAAVSIAIEKPFKSLLPADLTKDAA